jgi:hypothetical protein
MPIPEPNSSHWTPSDAARLPAETGPSPAALVPTAEIAAAVSFARAEKADATRRAYPCAGVACRRDRGSHRLRQGGKSRGDLQSIQNGLRDIRGMVSGTAHQRPSCGL